MHMIFNSSKETVKNADDTYSIHIILFVDISFC